MIEKFWNEGFLGNSWEHWASLGGILVLTFLLSWALRALLIVRLRKIAQRTETRWDDLILLLLEKTHFWFFFVMGLHLGMQSMELHPKVARASEVFFLLILFAQIGIWLSNAVTFWGKKYTEEAMAKDAGRATTLTALVFLGQVGIWSVTVLLLLGNLGYNVSALLAGLGVGGVAIALAVQNILGDLLASLSIVLDKPFVINDFIAVGDDLGKVEHIGLKTTRVKSLTGEQLIFSNSDLLRSRIRNYHRMSARRAVYKFQLHYQTPPAKLDRARAIVSEIIGSQPDCQFERCHLASFATLGVEYEVVYWVNKSDYLSYANAQHGIAVRMIDAFRREQIFFAFGAPAAVPVEAYQ